MKRLLLVAAVIAGVASPAFAYRDRKLQDAVKKATAQLQKGQGEQAVATLRKAASELGSGEAYLALGRIQQQASLIDDAVASYAKARELEASDVEVLLALGRIALSTGSAQDALVPVEKAVALDPSAEALATLSLVRMRGSDLAEAREAADKALAVAATSPLAHSAQGEIQLATGHAAEAAAAFRKALDLDPQLVEARVGLALALRAAGSSADALAEASRAATETPTSGEAAALQGLLMLAGHEGDAALWVRANEVAQDGAFRNPHSVVVQYLLGRVAELGPYPERSGERYRKALAIDPKYLPARLALASFLVGESDVASAFTVAQEIVADAPWSGEAQLLLGRELLRRKKASQALAPLEKASELAPGVAEAHALLATAAYFTGDSDRAVAEYAKALALRPDQLEWRADYGLFLGRSGEYEAAATELQKVVTSPGYRQAAGFVNLGWVYRNSRPPKVEESVRAYQKALEIDPKQAQAALGLGWAFFVGERYDESAAAYTKALALDSALAGEAYDGIAWDHYFQGDMAKAQEFGAKAKAAGRDDARLAEQIARRKKKQHDDDQDRERIKHEIDQAALCAAIDARLHGKDPGTRAPAVSELRVSGCAGIVPMLTWMLVNDSSYTVKQAVAEALGKIGPSAREATRYLKQCAMPCEAPINATPEELRQAMECADLRKACLSALEKLR
jgi:Tfp pilus assembly protein PilF